MLRDCDWFHMRESAGLTDCSINKSITRGVLDDPCEMVSRMDPSCVGNCAGNLLYTEINHENGTSFRCSICCRSLSRKQRIESHLSSVHGKSKKLIQLLSNSSCIQGVLKLFSLSLYLISLFSNSGI